MADNNQALQDLIDQFEAQGMSEQDANDKALMAYRKNQAVSSTPTVPPAPTTPAPNPDGSPGGLWQKMPTKLSPEAANPTPIKPLVSPDVSSSMKDFVASKEPVKSTAAPAFLDKPLTIEDRVKSRADLRQAAAVSAKNPKVAKVTVDYLTQEAEDLPEDQRDKFNAKIDDLKKVYDSAKDRTEWAEVGEKFGNALAGLGAAMYGVKHGYDMSGLKFDKTDWDKKYDRLMKERELGTSDLERQRSENLEEMEKAKGRNFEVGARNTEAANQASKAGAEIEGANQREATGQAHADARTSAELANRWQIAQLEAGVKEMSAKKAMSTQQNGLIAKARSALGAAGRAKDDNAKQTLMENARGYLSQAGMDEETAESIFTEPGMIWGRNDAAPVDVAKGLNFTQSYGVTPEAFDKFYGQSKAQGYKGTKEDAMRQLLNRIKQQEMSKANGQ